MKKIAVLTSGGDAPGMNAAIRAVTRCALDKGIEVLGVRNGYRGLMDGDYCVFTSRSVAGTMHRAGTMLGSSRAREFETVEGRDFAHAKMREAGIDGLVVIGGNGSQAGSLALFEQTGMPVAGVASTIDNDLAGTEATLGTDSALHVVLRAIDQLKVTASSHRRASIIEVMGRDCGYLALMAGLAGGAETIVIPEFEIPPQQVAREIREAYDRGKSHALVVVAEGASSNAKALSDYLNPRKEELGFELRVTVLGHTQRGGTPTPFDRLLGTRLGAAAVDALASGEAGVLCGWVDGHVRKTPLKEIVGKHKVLPPELLELGRVLAH